jgi:hypothetical protein
LICLFGLATVLLLVMAASALGQAAVDQYLPSAKPGSRHGSASAAVEEAIAPTTPSAPQIQAKTKAKKKSSPAAAVKGSSGGPGDGDGGFSLTPFVIIVIALFLAGLAARYLPRLVRRLRPAQPS